MHIPLIKWFQPHFGYQLLQPQQSHNSHQTIKTQSQLKSSQANPKLNPFENILNYIFDGNDEFIGSTGLEDHCAYYIGGYLSPLFKLHSKR